MTMPSERWVYSKVIEPVKPSKKRNPNVRPKKERFAWRKVDLREGSDPCGADASSERRVLP
ncbi:MAG: hypothetical protein HY078_15275 [Elusimicrobia bacterium]|nr:hypothetical protein [Elusimicrobiota bacterium]